MVMEFLENLKKKVNEVDYETIWNMAIDDIKFNMLMFDKKVSPEYFIKICERCEKTLNRCNGGIQ